MQKFKVRRRLVRLLKSKSIDLESDAGFVADYLISHGVTVLPKGTIVLTRAEIEALNKYQKRLNEGVITNNENKSNNSADKSNEKIEEMAKVIKSSLDGLGSGNFNFTGDEISTMFAEALYNAGYREAFEVAVFEKKLEETEEKLMACCMEQMNYDEMSIYHRPLRKDKNKRTFCGD